MAAGTLRITQAFALSWLLLLTPAVTDLVRKGGELRDLGLVVTAVFAGVYVWHWTVAMWRGGRERDGLLAWAALTLLGTALAFLPTARQPYAYIYAAVCAGSVMPIRSAAPAIAADYALTVAAYLVAGTPLVIGATAATQVLLFGAAVFLVRRLVEANLALRQAKEQIARLAVREERLRFARDLHDSLGQSLSVIALKSELADRVLASEPERAAAELRDVQRVAREALREVREVVGGYRRPTLASELGGARAALEAAGIACSIERPPSSYAPEIEAILAWAVREGVTNVVRHSRAARCAIRLGTEPGIAVVEIVDDGRGDGASAGGVGLRGLTERVTASGGRVVAGPLPGSGYRLRVDVPLARPGLA